MPLPERMKPARVTRKQMKELVSQLNDILDHIDNGMDENNEELKQMMADWNAQVVMPCGFSDFRDFSSWTSALDFTRMALNQEKYLDGYLMKKSGRWLNDAPDIQLVYAIPQDVYD